MASRSGAAGPTTIIFALVVALMFSIPTQAIAEEVAPEPPRSSLTPEEHEDFMQYWLDVFARGTRSLNDTPTSYHYDELLKRSLVVDLIERLKEESPDIARQFEPAVAGPMFGFSTPQDPLTGPDGSPITQSTIDQIYASFIGAIIFDRETFIARMQTLLDPMTPDEDALGAPPDLGEEEMRNEIRDALMEEPILEWANDLASPVAPEEFVTNVPAMAEATVLPVPMDLSNHVSTSPFNAAPASAWLDPDFNLALPNLLSFLSTLTELETDELLRELGLLAADLQTVVPRIEGTLDDFPELAGPIRSMEPLATAVVDAVVPLPAPVAVRISAAPPSAELPPAVAAAMEQAAALASKTQYVVVLNGVAYEGTWEVPLLIDTNGNKVPDAAVHLTLAVPTVGVGDRDVERVPLLSVERIDPAATGASVGPVPPGRLPGSALTLTDLTVAFRMPVTHEAVGYAISSAGGVDHLEVSLRDLGPSIDLVTTGGGGAFELAAVVGPGTDRHIAVITAPEAPQSASIASAVDAASGSADLTGEVVATGLVTLSGIHATTGQRLALGVSSAALAPFTLTTRGEDLDLRTLEGAALSISRQEGVAGSATTFTARTLRLSNAPERIEVSLGAGRLAFEATDAGANVMVLVGNVVANAFTSGAWAEISAAGKRATLDLADGGVAFKSDRKVDLVRAVRARTAAAALQGGIDSGLLYATNDLLAYSLEKASSASATPSGTGFDVEMVSSSTGGFFILIDRTGDRERYFLTNLPHRAGFDITPAGLTIGASENVVGVYGLLERALDGALAPPTTTVLYGRNVRGTAAVSMLDASVNTFLTGSVDQLTVVSSNVVNRVGQPIFAALPGQHTLADVDGLAHQHSASLLAASGSITGSLFGPLATIRIQLNIEGQLCQSFGNEKTTMTLCISNVPRLIELSLAALPNPTITYNASAVIGKISLSLVAPNVAVSFAILQIPKQIQITLASGALTLSSDTRLGGLTFTGAIGTTTLSAGLLDLPSTLTLTWSTSGMSPLLPVGDKIGRAYLFVSRPGLAFNVDIVHLPRTTIAWNANAITFGPVGDRIGSATVQLVVADVQLVVSAVGIPGATITWNTLGGTFGTNGALTSASITMTKGSLWAPSVSLSLSVVGVPQLTSSWSTNTMALTMLGASKITSITFQFVAGDLILYAGATGVPTSSFSMSGTGFSVSAPNAISSIILVFAKGSGYYDPFTRSIDFAGVYLRPDLGKFGVSAKLTGLKGVSYSKNDISKLQTLTVGFLTDKSFQVLADLDSAALTAYADVVITNLAATTSFTIGGEGVALTSTPIDPFRPGPWLQAYVGVGTPAAYAQTPDPRWPWQTVGDWRGIMGNTMLDTTVSSTALATKWKIYAPLPTAISLTKVTANGMPASYTLNTGVSLGKLDIRTGVKTNINPCIGCAPMILNTMAVATVSNLPTSLSVTEGLGSGSSAGSPTFTVSTAQQVNKIFLGIRFDNAWYATGDETGGFPIYGSLSQIPTTLSLTVSKAGGWNAGNTPSFSYWANANTLDASLYLNIGSLWTTLAKPTITAAAAAGRPVPAWLVGLAQMDARGHLLLQITDLPAAGIAMYRSGQNLVVDPLGTVPLTKLFVDFNLRFEKTLGNSGCFVCGVVQLDWWYSFGYWWEINQLSLLLENLRYVSIDPAIESIIQLDGHLVFHFRASAGIWFNAGVKLTVNVIGLSFQLLCICLPTISLSAMIDPGFISFQVQTFTWSVNYFTWGWPCHWAEPWYEPWWHAWCENHQYVGVTYTVPTNWQWDLPIAAPPLVPFRGLNLYTGTHHVFLDPRILNCSGNVCWEVGRLIPPSLVMAYAYVKYTNIGGVNWWTTYHEHWY